MTPEQLIDRLADALGVPGNAQRLVITRDWREGYLRVQIETHPTIDDAQAESIVRSAGDFTLTARGPSPVQAASSAFADHMAMQQAAIAQSMSMPADILGQASFELRELSEFRQSIEIQTGS